ncbi:unnamed protein product [Polarella glacialis]|uniref:Pre-mRNA-splicing factor 18 n=1 Tax=Polarella glacialis TaxID=89957 RepID=A0A813FF81_POLGL|nr:unnamed protein product [Polarella glacialis]
MAEPASEVAPAGQLDPPEAAKQPHWHQAQVQQKQREREQQQVRQHKEQHQQQVTMAAAIGKQDQEVAGVVEDRPFAQSALYQENRLQHGHSQVWGSWFDNSQQRWGYGCCRSVERAERCALAGDASAEVHPTADAVDAVSTESLEELPPRSSFSEPEIFVVRWVRAVLHEWRQRLEDQSGTALALGKRFASAAQLEEAERAIAPLIQLLEANSASFWRGEAVHIWSVGHKRWMTEAKVSQVVKANAVNGDSRHPAGSVLVAFAQDEDSERKGRKWVTPPHFETLLRKAHKADLSQEAIDKLARISELALEREYSAANQAYIELTVGSGKWHGSLSVKGMTGCAKAPRGGFQVKRDQVSFLETEEAVAYMFCLKRLVAFCQLLRPNTDVSKHCT